jgi:hypothetical protein
VVNECSENKAIKQLAITFSVKKYPVSKYSENCPMVERRYQIGERLAFSWT